MKLKLSEETAQELFVAIDEPMTDLRLKVQSLSKEEIDGELFQIVFDIHRRVKEALDIIND